MRFRRRRVHDVEPLPIHRPGDAGAAGPEPPSRARIWLRRLGALLLIAAMIAVPVYVFLTREDDELTDSEKAALDASADPAQTDKFLTQIGGDPKQGIEVRHPDDWTLQVKGKTVRLASMDRTTTLGITGEGKPQDAPAIFRSATDGAKKQLGAKKATFPGGRTKVSGLPTATAVVQGKAGGAKRSALIAVARGKKRSYVITVLAPTGGGQLGIANLILVRGLTLSG